MVELKRPKFESPGLSIHNHVSLSTSRTIKPSFHSTARPDQEEKKAPCEIHVTVHSTGRINNQPVTKAVKPELVGDLGRVHRVWQVLLVGEDQEHGLPDTRNMLKLRIWKQSHYFG